MVELKGLHTVKVKKRTYYYAWRGGPRLTSEFGTPAFFAEWEAAKHPEYKGDESKFATWIEKFRRSEEFKAFADSTRYRWGKWLDRIELHFGALALAQFDRRQIRVDIKAWRDTWRAHPRTADYGKQVLSRVLSFTIDNEKLKWNACSTIKNLYDGDRSDIIWTEADLAQLLPHASAEVKWVVQLAAATGFRMGDLMTLNWSHVGASAIEIRTGKSRRRRHAFAPLTAEIRELLAAIPKRSPKVLTNSRGLPWRGFSTSWRDTLIAAEMQDRDLHFHDLRGTAVTRYYRANFTIREIANIMGWSEDKVERILDRYVKRDALMADMIARLEALQKQEVKL